jgi:hypothetical protein
MSLRWCLARVESWDCEPSAQRVYNAHASCHSAAEFAAATQWSQLALWTHCPGWLPLTDTRIANLLRTGSIVSPSNLVDQLRRAVTQTDERSGFVGGSIQGALFTDTKIYPRVLPNSHVEAKRLFERTL